jgi:hypothetical protein
MERMRSETLKLFVVSDGLTRHGERILTFAHFSTVIAFLWFIAIMRNCLGELEDRFFATMFLGAADYSSL